METVAEQIIKGITEFAEALENNENITDKFVCHKVVKNEDGTIERTTTKPNEN